MDDPWVNAWNERKTTSHSKSNWPDLEPSNKSLQSETDVAVPSWETGSSIQWSEPSEDQSALWHSNNEGAQAWISSPYENLRIGNASAEPLPDDDDGSLSQEVNEQIPPHQAPVSPEKQWTSVTPVHDLSPAQSRSATPILSDAFGTFESGPEIVETELDPWATSKISPEAPQLNDAWPPSWTTSDPGRLKEVQSAEEPIDEWEAARRHKELQDQHVPPHILTSVLSQFQELADDMWLKSLDVNGENIGVAQRHSAEDVEESHAVTNQFTSQPLSFPQYVQFSRTFTAKRLGDSLRVTRHVPITGFSPFTLYLASKGSIAWEISVKSRIDGQNDDLLPPGWRVVEENKEETVPTTDSKKKSGGLLSLFGKKMPPVPTESYRKRSESPGRSTASVASPAVSTTSKSSPIASSSARASIDSVKTPPRAATPTTAAVLPMNATASSDSAIGALVQPQPSPDVPVTTQSAVSRFFTRFGRGKTGSTSRSSLTLSTDDFEFLSDAGPNANDKTDELHQHQENPDVTDSSRLYTTLTSLPNLSLGPSDLSVLSDGNSINLRHTSSKSHDDFLNFLDSASVSSGSNISPTQVVKTGSMSYGHSSTPIPLPPHHGTASIAVESQFARQLSSSSLVRPSSRSSTPVSVKRTPVAIMSSVPTSSSSSALPVPPVLPPPPSLKPIFSHPGPPTITQKLLEDDFTPRPSLSPDASSLSTLSDQRVTSSSLPSIGAETNFFDDFDDFVSSPMDDFPPTNLPMKPTHLPKPILPYPQSLAQTPIKHPTDALHKTANVSNHHCPTNLEHSKAAHTGVWPTLSSLDVPQRRPPSIDIRKEMLEHRDYLTLPRTTSQVASSSTFTSTLRLPLANAVTTTQDEIPKSSLQNQHQRAPTPSKTAVLSAQDLSFFEGL